MTVTLVDGAAKDDGGVNGEKGRRVGGILWPRSTFFHWNKEVFVDDGRVEWKCHEPVWHKGWVVNGDSYRLDGFGSFKTVGGYVSYCNSC